MEREERQNGPELDLEAALQYLRERFFECLKRLLRDDVNPRKALAELRDVEAHLAVVQRVAAVDRRLRSREEKARERERRRLVKATLRSHSHRSHEGRVRESG